MLSEHILSGALTVFLAGLEEALLPMACASELQRQQQMHDEVADVGRPIDNPRQYTDNNGNFRPNRDQAEEYARERIRVGVGRRLRIAITHYSTGNQMECVRHLVLALDTVFCILGWREASAWCNQQNNILFARKLKRAI